MPNIYRNPAGTEYLHYLTKISLIVVGTVRQVPIRDWKEAGSNKRLERGGDYHDYIFILTIFTACIEVNCNVLVGFRQLYEHILERQWWRKDGNTCLTVVHEALFWKLICFESFPNFLVGRIRVTQQYILKIHSQYFVQLKEHLIFTLSSKHICFYIIILLNLDYG